MFSKNLLFILSLTLVPGAFAPSAFAYTPVGHEQITKAALRHIAEHPAPGAAFDRWLARLSPQDRIYAEQVLLRSTVDLDFIPDLFGKVLGFEPVAGLFRGNEASFFSCFFHFINVTRPGDYWEYDGYAYRNRWGDSKDGLLGLPLSSIRADLSPPLGGYLSPKMPNLTQAPPNNSNVFSMGPFRTGFRGSNRDWQEMFFGNDNAERAVFPPAYVPAEIAFAKFLASEPSPATEEKRWTESFALLKPILKKLQFIRWYWTAQVKGLPAAFDKLGYALHMTQDMCEPHHTQGTLDFCHHEVEVLLDTLNCGGPSKVPAALPYSNGSYAAGKATCDRLYDPALVERLMVQASLFHPDNGLSLSRRLIELAKITTHWRWGDPVNSVDPIGTVLPDGKIFTGESCEEVLRNRPVREQLGLQFNLAVAATVAVLRYSAQEYERVHPAAKTQ